MATCSSFGDEKAITVRISVNDANSLSTHWLSHRHGRPIAVHAAAGKRCHTAQGHEPCQRQLKTDQLSAR
jgi:hypothetical protein